MALGEFVDVVARDKTFPLMAVQVSRIPNFPVFYALARQLLGAQSTS